jgi:protein-L-isoaspartate(D-aspartate) O-methyltransferase
MTDPQALVREIAADFRATAELTGRAAMSPRVAAALAKVPRQRFVRPGEEECAWLNRPLAIGHGQTISQPFIVALMTELLDPQPTDRVLEIGTGSGYQAAVLAELVARVHSIEIVAPLAAAARARLAALGYSNVALRTGDGQAGWPEAAPFDAIIVTAAGALPAALSAQLRTGGKLLMPVTRPNGGQELVLFTKGRDGALHGATKLPVRFVPLTGGDGAEREPDGRIR